MEIGTRQRAKISISAVVTRADGTVEDRGVIAEGSGDMPPTFFAALKAAWAEGWTKGKKSAHPETD